MKIMTLRKVEDLPRSLSVIDLAKKLHQMLKPFEDTVDEITRGLNDALQGKGFINLGLDEDENLMAAVVMMKTGMGAYIPENLLLYVAVDPKYRGQGLGGKILKDAFSRCEGSIKLHVEHDNPAQRLYERMGFTSKYREMRLTR